MANLQQLDAMLVDKQWLMGDQFTVADGYALVFYGWALASGMDVARFTAYSAFKDRMLARPATRRALERERHVLVNEAKT